MPLAYSSSAHEVSIFCNLASSHLWGHGDETGFRVSHHLLWERRALAACVGGKWDAGSWKHYNVVFFFCFKHKGQTCCGIPKTNQSRTFTASGWTREPARLFHYCPPLNRSSKSISLDRLPLWQWFISSCHISFVSVAASGLTNVTKLCFISKFPSKSLTGPSQESIWIRENYSSFSSLLTVSVLCMWTSQLGLVAFLCNLQYLLYVAEGVMNWYLSSFVEKFYSLFQQPGKHQRSDWTFGETEWKHWFLTTTGQAGAPLGQTGWFAVGVQIGTLASPGEILAGVQLWSKQLGLLCCRLFVCFWLSEIECRSISFIFIS